MSDRLSSGVSMQTIQRVQMISTARRAKRTLQHGQVQTATAANTSGAHDAASLATNSCTSVPPPACLPVSYTAHLENEVPSTQSSPDRDSIPHPDLTGEVADGTPDGNNSYPGQYGQEFSASVIIPPQCALSMDGSEIMDTLEKRANRIMTWECFLSLFLTSGYGNFTVDQYALVNDILTSRQLTPASSEMLPIAEAGFGMPSYSTTRDSIWSEIRSFAFPSIRTVHLGETKHPRSSIRSSSNVQTTSGQSKDPRDCARVILPSEWARIDVQSRTFYEEVYGRHDSDSLDRYTIEASPMARARDIVLNRKLRVWVLDDDLVTTASSGDLITFHCQKVPETPDKQTYAPQVWSTSMSSTPGARSCHVQGIVGPMWVVCARNSEKPDPSIPPDMNCLEESLWRALHFSNLSVSRNGSSSNAKARNATSCTEHTGDSDDDEWDYNVFESTADNASNRTQQLMTFYVPSASSMDVLPGDICTIIRPNVASRTDTNVICLYHASMLGPSQGMHAERLVWIARSTYPHSDEYVNVQGKRTKPRVVAQAVVTSMPIAAVTRESGEEPTMNLCNTGKLQTGEDYLVYRFCLYADGFKQVKSLSDTRSVTGCYILPMGISLNSRTSSRSTRVLTLCPSGHDVNCLMDEILQDIVQGTVEGIRATDPYGRKVRIFLDAVTFLGDYPAVTAVTDTLGHTANSFCTLCSISKRPKENVPRILYTSNIHSRRMAFCRFKERLDAIRCEYVPSDLQRRIGMKGQEDEATANIPLVKLERDLEERRDEIPTTLSGMPVVPGMFDASLSTASAPEHLLSGLAKNALTISFKMLPSDEERQIVEVTILSFLKSNRLPTDRSILKWDRGGKCKGLQSMTMSSIFCTLLVASHVFRKYENGRTDSPFYILSHLHEIVANVFWAPTFIADGADNVEYVRAGTGPDYLRTLYRLCTGYLSRLRSLNVRFGALGKILDKSNAHRLLELIVHTIPAFSHAAQVAELVLENMHQQFKTWLEKNTHPGSHLTAVDRLIRRDWLSRIASSRQYQMSTTEDFTRSTPRDLLRLFVGSEIYDLDTSHPRGYALLQRLESKLDTMFLPPVTKFLSLSGPSIQGNLRKSNFWEGRDRENHTR